MGCFWMILYIAATLLARLEVMDGAGVIEIKLISYKNIFGMKSGNPNRCCDVMSDDVLQCRSQPCDPFFDFCLQNMTHSGCGLGRQVTGYTRDQDDIVFINTIGHNYTGNPLRFPVSQFFDNQLTIMVIVYDEDKGEGKQTNDRLDYMQQVVNYTPDFNGTHKTTLNFTLSGKVSSFSIQVNIRCGTFYYGNSCAKRCRSDKQTYDCNNNGDRTCLPGWAGMSCASNVDECANNSCQNGATCKDGVNSYSCECLSNFTGRYCESVITSSTTSPSTTTTTKGTTVTSPFTSPSLTSTLPVTTTISMTNKLQMTTALPTSSSIQAATTFQQTTDPPVNTSSSVTAKITTMASSPLSTKQSPANTTTVYTQSSIRTSSRFTSTSVSRSSSPKASHFGRSKMAEPKPSGGSPGPLIGGVFGGLVVAAGLVVIGFFIYKRKRERMNQQVGKTNQDKRASPGPRDCGDGKSVHEAGDEHGDTKTTVEDKKHAQGSPRKISLSDELKLIDF